MPGPNLTGTQNVDEYNLGRGIVYLSDLNSDGTPTNQWRDVGNATEFNITVETETLEHFSSRAGVRVKDKEVIVQTEMNVSITLDSINDQNVSLFFLGETANYTNVTAFTEHAMIENAVLGRWYDIVNAAGARAYDIATPANLVLQVGANNLVSGTDYILDAKAGRVFLPVTATDGAGGGAGSLATEDIDVTLTTSGGDASIPEVRALTNSGVSKALKFISVNPAASDAKTEYQIHKITLKPEGDFGLISDEWTTMTLNGAAEANPDADADSQYLTQRYLGT